MCKVSCSLKRVKKAVPDSRQFMVKMYVEDKKSHVGPISLPVRPEMTLSNLKKKIEAEYNFPVKIQRWILGKNLATDDSATLEHYGVSHSACPVFLYLVSPAEHTSNEQQDQGEPSRVQRHPPRSIASTEEASEAISPPLARRGSNASSTLDALLNDQNAGWTCELCGIKNIEPDACAMCGAPMNVETPMDVYDEVPVADAVTSEAGDEQLPRALSPQDYARMMELEEQDIVPSMEAFECSVCFLDVGPGEGALLRDCLHMFC
ncbi:ubiquitin-conjugating enzyme, putative, partial [Ixodes scapularis]